MPKRRLLPAGRTALNKVIFNLTSKAQSVEEVETGEQATYKPTWKVRFSTPESGMKHLLHLY